MVKAAGGPHRQGADRITFVLPVIHYLFRPLSSKLSRLASMPLPAGTELGTHKIIALIGVGGMVEVCKAQSKLSWAVAAVLVK